MENRFKNFEQILNNFDDFCNEFESRAANAFLRGDQNDGRVTEATANIGDSTPEVVREITESGIEDLGIGETIVDVSSSTDE